MVLTAAAVTLAACTAPGATGSSTTAPGPVTTAGEASAAGAPAAGSPVASPSPSTPAATTRVPPASPPRVGPPPSQTAGLTAAAAPAPERLGRGWSLVAPTTAAEDGIVGNGAPAQARDPRDVAAALAILGCGDLRAPAPLPVPRSALEVHYRGPRGVSAVALVLAFPTPARADGFLAAYLGNGRGCSSGSLAVPAGGHGVAVRVDAAASGTTVLEHHDDAVGEQWLEAMGRRDGRVVLLSVATTDPTVMTPARLAEALPP